MKIQPLTEKIRNLNRVVDNSTINAVTEMPPVMSDAYEDSVELDDAIEKGLKDKDALPKDKPFLGASKQPVPKEPEEAKITLDESLFDENDLRYEIYDFLDELSGYSDWNQKIKDVVEEFGISTDEAEGYVWDWSIRYNSNDLDTDDQEELEENLDDEDDQFDFNASIFDAIADVYEHYKSRGYPLTFDDIEKALDWFSVHYKDFLVEKLHEDGRQGSLLRQYSDKDDEEEELDLWTKVYASLIENPTEATITASKLDDIFLLPKKKRYSVINTDADGNIIVYGKTEKELEPAIQVAKHYGLEHEIKKSPSHWVVRHPEQAMFVVIDIPEDQVYDPDKK